MKIAHEAPLSIFDKVQEMTDYDYALVHLFEENKDYWNKFVEAREKGREIILDNSIFELGTAWSGDSFAYWVKELKPTWYIVPDVLNNKQATIESFESFIDVFPSLPGKRIAVAQGSTYDELVECYEYFVNNKNVDKIALSFDHPFFEDLNYGNKYYNMMIGRQTTLASMLEDGIINKNKPHHLLGCGLPQEFKKYRDLNYNWIDSIDTSNPVIHGIKNIRYQEHGLDNKESVKLFTMMEEDVLASWETIAYNISKFKEFCNG